MLKGLISLFTSGVIFSPMVLCGIISGFYVMIHFEAEQIRSLFLDSRFYGIVAVGSVLYTALFARIYQEGGEKVDWSATFVRMIWNIFRYFLAFVLSMSFVTMVSIF